MREYVAHLIFNHKGISTGVEFGSRIVRCADCRYYSGKCCLRFGKSGKPGRNEDDFCSRGEEREDDREL